MTARKIATTLRQAHAVLRDVSDPEHDAHCQHRNCGAEFCDGRSKRRGCDKSAACDCNVSTLAEVFRAGKAAVKELRK